MSERRLILATTELHPETAGGAGVLVDALARRLKHIRPVTVVLCASDVNETMPREGVDVVTVSPTGDGFMERSRVIAEAVASVARPGDRVEFQDFEGLAFHALGHRAELGLESVSFTVRFHGPYDLLAEAMDTRQDDWAVPIAMEREAYGMADLVLVPVPGHRETVIDRYGVDPERVVVAPPPVGPLPRIERHPHRPVFAVIGRLAEVKGSPDMVAAALRLLDQGVDLRVRFVGGDGWSPTTGTTMSARLEAMIPERHRPAFEFLGPVDRPRLREVLGDVTAVVVPSRFESFCLAAHEARSMGLPVVVTDLAAFRGLLDEDTGALVVAPSVHGIAEGIQRLVTDPDIGARLASAPVPDPGDPVEPYRADPAPRHPRAQAGLATAATDRLARLIAPRSPEAPGLRRFLLTAPDRVHNLLWRMPRFVRHRLTDLTGWEKDEYWVYSRRDALARKKRLDRVRERIQAGEFPESEHPDVTVVIPVFNDVGFLEETLASVYEQTHPSWEIVLVDDGSTDRVAMRYLDRLSRPRLRVIRQANRGLPAARNAGMKVARGRYFVPLDADDQLMPDFVQRMLAALESRPDAGYAHCYARLHHDIDAVWMTRPFNPYWQLLGNGVVGCVLLRGEAWEEVGGYDETMTLGNEDWEMWLRLQSHGWGQVQVPAVLFKYRKHGISMSVRTEARFEEGRRMVVARHPELYDPVEMRRLKRQWYPLITAVTDEPSSPDAEVEAVPDLDDLADTWGKYVVDIRGIEPFPLETLLRMAELLEETPKARAAVTKGNPPLVMVRRWALHDPGSGHVGEVVCESDLTGRGTGLPDHVPRAGWSVPPEIVEPDVPVQRQPPEEDGWIPDVSEW